MIYYKAEMDETGLHIKGKIMARKPPKDDFIYLTPTELEVINPLMLHFENSDCSPDTTL